MSGDYMSRVQLSGPAGLCLDGSRPVYYIHRGAVARKWVVFFEGGDWCTRWEETGVKDFQRSCYTRSFSSGSSSRSGPLKSLAVLGQLYGVLSSEEERNPLAHDWNKVYVKNCDASSYTSSLERYVRVRGRSLFFRGKAIMEELIQDLLDKQGLQDATDLVIAGCSAGIVPGVGRGGGGAFVCYRAEPLPLHPSGLHPGGLSVHLHAPAWREALKGRAVALGRPDAADIRVAALVDSGFFLLPAPSHRGLGDYDYAARMAWLYRHLNSSAAVSPECAAALGPSAAYQCLFAQHALRFSPVPTFSLQSVADPWQLEWVAHNSTADSPRGRMHMAHLWQELAGSHGPDAPAPRGLFADACPHHCHCYTDLRIQGASQGQAFARFYTSLAEGGSGGAMAHPMWWAHHHACSTHMAEEPGADCPLKHFSWQLAEAAGGTG